MVRRVLEADVIPTVSISMIPDGTRSVGSPRVARIACPMSRLVGRPGDAAGQREVPTFLRATLYRWAPSWPDCCRPLVDAPLAMAESMVRDRGDWRRRARG